MFKNWAVGVATAAALFTSTAAALADYDWKENFTRISRRTAHRIALTQAPGYVKNSDLDIRNGRARWKVQVRGPYGQKRDVFIDATTGAIIGVRFKG